MHFDMFFQELFGLLELKVSNLIVMGDLFCSLSLSRQQFPRSLGMRSNNGFHVALAPP